MKSKLLYTAFSFFVWVLPTSAQVVTEDVLFNTYNSASDNDFANHFTGGLGLSQITTNGITGGCLTTPNTINWGNDNAIYCSKYIAANTYSAITKISFRYDSTQINSTNFDRAVSIFLRPSADFNHYVIASVNYNKRLQVVTYSWANSPPLLNLLQDHWYELILNTTFTTGSPTYQVNINAQVNDLGVTGQLPPIPTGNSSGIIYDSLLFGDSAVQVSVTGTAWGGAKYLDNFHFQGLKSADSCISIPTSVSAISKDEFSFAVRDNSIILTDNSSEPELAVEVFSIEGQKIFSARTHEPFSSYNISDFAPGLYLFRAGNKQKMISGKFALIK